MFRLQSATRVVGSILPSGVRRSEAPTGGSGPSDKHCRVDDGAESTGSTALPPCSANLRLQQLLGALHFLAGRLTANPWQEMTQQRLMVTPPAMVDLALM